MHLDVSQLKEFYARPLGATARRLLVHRLRAKWRNVSGLTVFGLGYATPFLGAFREEAACIGALMPAAQGVYAWPSLGPHQSALVDDRALPLPDASIDRLLIVHGLEMSEALQPFLRECWRVLSPEGRMILVLPNRRGIWARFDSTPFGFGRPFSPAQIRQLLDGAMFNIRECDHALHMPPLDWSIITRSATAWERTGAGFWPVFSGVILVEAEKNVAASLPGGRRVPARAIMVPTQHRQRLPQYKGVSVHHRCQ